MPTIEHQCLRRVATLGAATLSVCILAGCDGGDSDEEAGSTAATAGAACEISGSQQELGASYVTSIEVQGVSCGKAEEVVKAYHRCRQANGGAGGTCESDVQGFTCTEGEREAVPGVQYNATVECSGPGGQQVNSTYTQNL